jgi:hypothetical protein
MLDIQDLFVNITIKGTIDITRTQLLMNNDGQLTNQITALLEIILGQNYFSFQGQIYQPDKGIAMGSPISGIVAEIFLQQLEKVHIKHLVDSNHITFYTRYVDDILIVYDSTLTTHESILQYINRIHSNIQLNPTQEVNGIVSFLDLSVTRKPTCLVMDIYRKPTTTDTTINYLSIYPLEHKLVAYRFLIRRMLNIPLNKEQQQKEWKNIQQIACNNNFPSYIVSKLKQKMQQRAIKPQPPPATTDTDTHWATFTYISPQIGKITNLFKHTNVKIAFECNNTVAQLTKPVTKTPAPPPPMIGVESTH